jgi:hypothetical protein
VAEWKRKNQGVLRTRTQRSQNTDLVCARCTLDFFDHKAAARPDASLHSILAVLSVSIFKQVDIHKMFTQIGLANPLAEDPNHLVMNY